MPEAPQPTQRAQLGAFGERVAARFLIDRGAEILDRNVRIGRGEIDLHACIDGEVTVVEVKTRDERGLDPVFGIDDAKLTQVRDLAARLRPPARRVDFVGVTVGRGGVDIHWLRRV